MLQVRRDRMAERIAAARLLATDGRADELRALVDELRADPDAALGPDELVLLGVLTAVAATNTQLVPEAAAALDELRPLLVAASPVMQARFHSLASHVAHAAGDDDAAVSEVVVALAALESVSEPSEDLAVVLTNSAASLANCQLFSLAVETAERGVAVAEAAGLPAGMHSRMVAYAHLAWAMRLEHLGLTDDGAQRWAGALEHFDRTLADRQVTPLHRAMSAAYRAVAAARLGEPGEARRCLDRSRATPARPVTPDLRRLRLHAECAVLIAEDRPSEARHLLTAYWQEAGRLRIPPWTEDAAFLLARVAEVEGRTSDALRWYREVHERYGRAQYEVWLSRATAARLRVEQEALLRRARELEYDALSDPLTGVPNRRAFDATLPRLVGDAQAAGAPLTLVILDVDRFKRVNDTHGHLVGDEVLRTVARLLRDCTRDADRCARYGGDEFVLCLPAPEREAAAAVARLVGAVAGHPWSELAAGLTVSVTAGLAELGPTDTSSTLFWAADQSLLRAKRARPAVPAPRPH
jgi:diguanylate cyclase (GGDEF)-like protein